MNLGTFKAQIAANIRRGNSLDAQIPTFIRQAAQWIERNQTLSYMKRMVEVNIDLTTSSTPRFIELQGTRIKGIIWFRWLSADGRYIYLKSRSAPDFGYAEEATPRYYWLDGVSRIVLAATPTENLAGELMVARYTDWPTEDAAEPWLLKNAEDVLEARTMMNFGKYVRDPQVVDAWRTILDDSLAGLYAADAEFEYGNADMAMEGR